MARLYRPGPDCARGSGTSDGGRTARGEWRLVRLGCLGMPETVAVGPMARSPTRAGLDVTFAGFRIEDPIPRDLH